MNLIKKHLIEHGLSTFVNKNMVFICPPLCIKEEELQDGLKIIEEAFKDV
jgi:adenosylmethionine-8-amino-7-oxononanoate aminotransferase